jgi:hypothetical protein
MDKPKKVIIDLFEAPLIKCKVFVIDTNEVIYDGDSSYEMHQAYDAAHKNGVKVASTLASKKVYNDDDKDKVRRANDKNSVILDLIERLPLRIQSIYKSILTGKPVDDGSLMLAKQFHPQYFNLI